jgi:hypothetical protein
MKGELSILKSELGREIVYKKGKREGRGRRERERASESRRKRE